MYSDNIYTSCGKKLRVLHLIFVSFHFCECFHISEFNRGRGMKNLFMDTSDSGRYKDRCLEPGED